MGDVVKFKRASLREKSDGRTLCSSGFHKWKVMTERRFDVKRGKLTTVERCTRCGTERTRFT
jgi:hypothetical protein